MILDFVKLSHRKSLLFLNMAVVGKEPLQTFWNYANDMQETF